MMLLTPQVKLADLQADPNSPLYSVKTFEELPMCVSAECAEEGAGAAVIT